VARIGGPSRWTFGVCNANQGLRGDEIDSLPTDRETVERHIREAHRPDAS